MAVSLVMKILPVCYKKHPYHSDVFFGCLLLSSVPSSTNLLTLRDKRELSNPTSVRFSVKIRILLRLRGPTVLHLDDVYGGNEAA